MNLDVKPETIPKKRIIMYIVISLICVLAIAVVIGVEILGNDVVDNIFGINKITQRSAEEESTLKANFENIFDNKVEDNGSYKIKKIDSSKDIVFTDYNKKEQNNKYEIDVNLPYINIKNNDDVNNFNTDMKNTFAGKAEEIIKSNQNNKNNSDTENSNNSENNEEKSTNLENANNSENDNEENSNSTTNTTQNQNSNNSVNNTSTTNIVSKIYTVKYKACVSNDILSVIIYSDLKEGVSAQRTIIQTFNYDLKENKQLSLEDMINKFDLKENEVQSKINSDIQKEQQKSEDLIKLGYKVFSRNTKSNIYKIENITEFFVYNNNIYIIFAYGNTQITSEKDIVII